MAGNDKTQETTSKMSEETNIPLSTSVQKPEEVHERPTSSGSSDVVSDDVDLEKQKQADEDMPPAAPVQSEAESVYPGTAQTAAVMLCICLTIFLVALVRSLPRFNVPLANCVIGSNNHRDSHPKDHRRIQLDRRHWMVW
jgi:hypothetical protein